MKARYQIIEEVSAAGKSTFIVRKKVSGWWLVGTFYTQIIATAPTYDKALEKLTDHLGRQKASRVLRFETSVDE